HPYCPKHDIPITSQTVQQMTDQLMQMEERTKIQILAPVISGRKGEHAKVLEDLQKEGYVRLRIDGEMCEVTDDINLEKNKKHSMETAVSLGEGRVIIDVIDGEELIMNEQHACPICGFSIDELEPRLFSFNSPYGACPTCDGLGTNLEVDKNLVIPDKNLTLNEHAIAAWEPISSNYYPSLLKSVCSHYDIDMNIPVKKIPKKQMDIILYGSGKEY